MAEKINSEALQVTSFDIIFYSGNARTPVHEAFRSMCKEMFEEVEEKLRQASEEILHAHQSQTQLLKKYASGIKIEMETIMVHTQNHLTTTVALLEVTQEVNYLYQKNKQKGRIVVQDTIKGEIELEERQLSLKNMYFDRYLVVRYLTVFFFFMNMQWMTLLLSAKSLGSSSPMTLILAILLTVREQVKLHRKYQTDVPWTRWYSLFQSVFNLLAIPVLFISGFTFLHPFTANGNGGQLFVFTLVVGGIFVSAFIQYRLKKISLNQDQQYTRIKQYEKVLYLGKEDN